MLTSKDGISWSKCFEVETPRLNYVTFSEDLTIASDFRGDIYYSRDRKNWTKTSIEESNHFIQGLAYNGKTFVAVGSSIWYSKNGIDWVKKDSIGSDTYNNLIYDGKQFILIYTSESIILASSNPDTIYRQAFYELRP